MRYYLRACILLLCSNCFGQLSAGDSEYIESLFEKADIVCLCTIRQYSATVRPGMGQQIINVTPSRVYKGSSVLDVRSVVVPDNFGLAAKSTYLLFLKLSSGLSPLIINVVEIPQSFLPVSRIAEPGSFQEDLDEALTRRESEKLRLLQLFRYISSLSPQCVSVLKYLSSSTEHEVSLLSTATLIEHDVQSSLYYPRFITELSQTPVSSWPPFDDLTIEFLSYSNVTDIQPLEVLSNSSRLDIRYDALRALRKLASPSTVDFFLTELDSEDELTQYLAVISLAEINSKTGDYAPGLGMFKREKSRYINIWKQWARERHG